MKRYKKILILFLSVFVALEPALCTWAAEPDQRIDQSNWQKVKGLMPEQSLNWVKKGDMVINIGKLDYDPAQVQPAWVLKSKKENLGKYKLNASNTILEAATDKAPTFIKGIPFPDVKLSDPQGAAKVMWNTSYIRNANGPYLAKLDMFNLSRGGRERKSIKVDWIQKPYDGFAPAEKANNQNNYELTNILNITNPFDMAGTAMMTWRYKGGKDDMFFGYVPAIRRVRRLTPASRSDALFGSDMAKDDGAYGLYDGQVKSFKWRFLGEGEIIGAFAGGSKPLLVTPSKDGGWAFPKVGFKWSYEKKGGSAAPWFVENALWVKRPVWIIEGIPKDPYYNYGKAIHYIDKETNLGYWKIIFDRSGKYWKTLWVEWAMGQNAAKTMGWNAFYLSVILDERSKRATAIDCSSKYVFNTQFDDNMFTLSGFTAVCK